MMKNAQTNFVIAEDGEQIFFQTNFKHDEKPKNVIVFNYGLICSNFHWSKQIACFEELGYKILIHDYRGHFRSSGKDNLPAITFQNIASDLHQVIQHLRLDNLTFVGHSMGVNVCFEFANQFPDLVKRMILISGTLFPIYNIMMDSHLTGPGVPLLKSLAKSFPKEVDLFWKTSGWNPIMRKLIHRGGFNSKTVGNDFIEVYMNKLGQLGVNLFFQLLDQMHGHDILASISRIESKCLVIGGNKDKVIPNFSQRYIHECLKDSELYIIKDGSHVPQVDFPKNINERILLFLETT